MKFEEFARANRVTIEDERHYSPWIRERQEQAEADVRRTWTQDPIALLENEGDTRGTQEQRASELNENKQEVLAERVGFEPTVGVSLHTLSKRAP